MATHAPTTGAPTRAPAITRRSLFAAAAIVPVLASVPALAAPASPFRIAEARFRAATDRFNGLPADLETADPIAYDREEQAFLAALDAVDEAHVADWGEFAAAFDIASDNGRSPPNEDLMMKLLADARRLAGRA